MPDLIFLDANVICSAAYRPTSEVERNLHPTRHDDLQFLLQAITGVPTPPPGQRSLPSKLVLPAKDAPIFQAAAAAEATHLLTGDRWHFGVYYGQQFEGVLILTARTYLRSRITGNP